MKRGEKRRGIVTLSSDLAPLHIWKEYQNVGIGEIAPQSAASVLIKPNFLPTPSLAVRAVATRSLFLSEQI